MLCPGFYDVGDIKEKKQKHEFAYQVMGLMIPNYVEIARKPATKNSRESKKTEDQNTLEKPKQSTITGEQDKPSKGTHSPSGQDNVFF